MIEEIQVFKEPQRVQSLVLSSSKVNFTSADRKSLVLWVQSSGSRPLGPADRHVVVLQEVLYVGGSGGVAAVPVSRCSVYRSCRQCILARDPLCVWSRSRKVCTGLDQNQEDM